MDTYEILTAEGMLNETIAKCSKALNPSAVGSPAEKKERKTVRDRERHIHHCLDPSDQKTVLFHVFDNDIRSSNWAYDEVNKLSDLLYAKRIKS